MQKLKSIVIDDVENNRKMLKGMLEEVCKQVDVVAEAYDVPSAVKAIKKHNPDLIFLDIEMPGISGLQLFNYLEEEDLTFETIFTTAYSEYAIQAFKLSAIDYLLKPLQLDEIINAVTRAEEKRNQKNLKERYQALVSNLKSDPVEKIAIPVTEGLLFLPVKEIIYCKAEGAYTKIFTENKSVLLASKKIGDFEELLNTERMFFRVHRSYLINLNKIKQFLRQDRGIIVMENNDELDLARDRRNEFFDLVEKLKI